MFALLAIAPMVLGFVVATLATLAGLLGARKQAQRAARLAALDLRATRRWQRATFAASACITYTCPQRVREDYWRSEALGAALLASLNDHT